VYEALQRGESVLLEGAQGALLDVDHGTYPYVTSSNTTAGGAAVGAGIGPTAIDAVLGVVKAYTTRVGNGPLPTEAEAKLAERIRTLGGEFGATTGRPRRCGWFDAVVVRYAVRVNGLTGLAVTKLDVLDSFSHIPVCVGYRLDGEPCGLAVGVAAKRFGLTCSLFDKGPVVASLMRYPLYMTFFSTPDKFEIGGMPFVTAADKPTRREALTYYRKVAEYFELDVRQYHTVERVTPETGGFELVARHPGAAEPEIVGARNIVCATGFFDSPNLLGVPGEDLPHVSHFFTEPHPYWQQ